MVPRNSYYIQKWHSGLVALLGFCEPPFPTPLISSLPLQRNISVFRDLRALMAVPRGLLFTRSLGTFRLFSSTPYQILGLPLHASLPEIKRRYRELAREMHPDANKSGGSSERMAALAGAYRELILGETNLAHDNRIESCILRCETIDDLKHDGIHDIIDVVLFLDQCLPVTCAKDISIQSGAIASEKIFDNTISSSAAPVETTDAILSLHPHDFSSVRYHTTSLDSIADLKRGLQAEFGVRWGLDKRRRDREGLALGWEVVHDSKVMCNNFFLGNYEISSGDRIQVAVRREGY